jgi:type II secretory ATPase GspE/PulE/Tfp pilus assembly ATPase PilB-like protein
LSLVDKNVKNLIVSKASPEEIFEWARNNDMITLQEAGVEKVIQGITTIEEVFRLTVE